MIHDIKNKMRQMKMHRHNTWFVYVCMCIYMCVCVHAGEKSSLLVIEKSFFPCHKNRYDFEVKLY